MSIVILRDGVDVTDARKLEKTYTRGYFPDTDLTQTYVIRYEQEPNEVNVEINFPPARQGRVRGSEIPGPVPKVPAPDRYEIIFETVGGDRLNNQTVTLDESSDYEFVMRIANSTLNSFDKRLPNNVDLFQHIINRRLTIVSNILIESTETVTRTEEVNLAVRFLLDSNEVSFETIEQTYTTVAVSMFVDYPDETSAPITRDTIPASDRPQLYRVEYNPITPGVVQRSRPVLRGFSDTSRPNSFIIDFERTSTSGDVNDRYNVIFNKSGYFDALGNDLFGSSTPINVVSGPVVVVVPQYITRMVDVFDNEFNLTNTLDSPDGLIDVIVSLRLYHYDGSTVGARVADSEINAFYIVAGGSGFDINGITMNGEEAELESEFGTRRFGPFAPGADVQIFGQMNEGSPGGRLTLTHYAYLNESVPGETPRSSQINSQTTTFDLVRSVVVSDPVIVDIPIRSMFTLNTYSEMELTNAFIVTDGGDIIPESEAFLSITDGFITPGNELSPPGTRLFMYNFKVLPPTVTPMHDGILQYRQMNRLTPITEWIDVPVNPYSIALNGIDGDTESPLVLSAERLSSGANTVTIGLVPFEFTYGSVYEFRTVAIENPDSIRTPEPNRYLMEPNPVVDTTPPPGTTTVPTTPSV